MAGISRVCTGSSNNPDTFRYTRFPPLMRRTISLRNPWEIGKSASVKHTSHCTCTSHYQVGPRFVQACLEAVASIQLAKRGLSLEQNAKLPTPRYLDIDEFARRKVHRYDTICVTWRYARCSK